MIYTHVNTRTYTTKFIFDVLKLELTHIRHSFHCTHSSLKQTAFKCSDPSTENYSKTINICCPLYIKCRTNSHLFAMITHDIFHHMTVFFSQQPGSPSCDLPSDANPSKRLFANAEQNRTMGSISDERVPPLPTPRYHRTIVTFSVVPSFVRSHCNHYYFKIHPDSLA